MLPFGIVYGERLVGQLNVSNIVRGALRSASVGYWIDSAVAGRGITPTALALTIDHCLTEARLHRVEVNIRPENHASLRVVEKLGLRQEGYHERFLDIDGAWRDHLSLRDHRRGDPDRHGAVPAQRAAGSARLIPARRRTSPRP